MSHLNCLRTMPEITDEAVIEALFAQRPYEEKVLNSAYLEIPAEYQRELSIPNIERMSAEFTEWIANPPKVSYRDGHYYVFDGQHTLMTRKAVNGGADLPSSVTPLSGTAFSEIARIISSEHTVSVFIFIIREIVEVFTPHLLANFFIVIFPLAAKTS